MPHRLAADAAPVAAGGLSALIAWFDLWDWWELGSRSYSLVIGACTLAYVVLRLTNEYRKWRSGKAEG